jgi:hypothetical protein
MTVPRLLLKQFELLPSGALTGECRHFRKKAKIRPGTIDVDN